MTDDELFESRPWVSFNQMTGTYDTPDGTKVAAELVDNVSCLADILRIASIRSDQRAAATAVCSDHDEDCADVKCKVTCWLYQPEKGRCPCLLAAAIGEKMP